MKPMRQFAGIAVLTLLVACGGSLLTVYAFGIEDAGLAFLVGMVWGIPSGLVGSSVAFSRIA